MEIFRNRKDYIENKKAGGNGCTQAWLDKNKLELKDIVLVDCFNCFNCFNCNNCNSCDYCNNCDSCNNCDGCDNCNSCNDCNKGVENDRNI